MSIVGFTLSAVEEFIPTGDPCFPDDIENCTVFELGTLPSDLQCKLLDRFTNFELDDKKKTTTGMIPVHQVAFEAAQFAIKGVRNFFDDEGNEIKLDFQKKMVGGKEYKVASHDFVSRIDVNTIKEIYERVMNQNVVTEEEVKNLGEL